MRGATILFRKYSIQYRDFNPRTPCGVRHRNTIAVDAEKLFQSTHPMRGATNSRKRFYSQGVYFNPRTPCGVRRCWRHRTVERLKFQSTHPMRGATSMFSWPRRSFTNFNPRTPCGVRRTPARKGERGTGISIHAPHAGCDSSAVFTFLSRILISIHAPHAGCDAGSGRRFNDAKLFQSTHPMRGATTTAADTACT